MKTIMDLEQMKNKSCPPFENEYEYFFSTLEDYYIGKSDGINRIKAELRKWDKDTASKIVEELINRMMNNGAVMFDVDDLSELSKFYNGN